MLEKLKELCALNGVSGNETAVSAYITNRAKVYTDDITVDVMGNVIIGKKGVKPAGAKASGKKIVLCAHMDEVGVVVTGITDDGYLKFAMTGGIDSRIVVGKLLKVGRKGIPGIIGCKAMHLVKAKDREKPAETDDLYIDIFAKDRAAAEELVSLGDNGVFDEDIREFGDGFLKAKAIDDRLGCAVLLELIESDLPVDCTFVFTVQEEVGLRGAYTAAFKTSPDIALIIEGTTAADLPSVTGTKKVCKPGEGAVIPFMDGGSIYNKEIREILTNIAGENNIPWQTKSYVAGSTDGAAFQRSRSGVKTAAISAPIRNLHSPSCVGKISDMDAVLKLTRLFLEKMSTEETGG